ncbi:MAG: GlsB/YeaQ/YmgE family stress response membrane protein [Chloroflexota bacterium]|nr:MAG: GlsB/YeaQ/YmgE family stress response membrane protein [Chloroflexota bacterium]
MGIVDIIVWIIVGAIAGWLASLVMRTNRSQGLLEDIIIGIVGAFIGGFVLQLLGVAPPPAGELNVPSILTAFLGAVILIAILRAIRRA